jgi:hypothetical protein
MREFMALAWLLSTVLIHYYRGTNIRIGSIVAS